jgi:type I restriction enzyme, S subunit
VTGHLRPYRRYKVSGLSWIDNIPAHWQVKRNGQLFGQRKETGFAELPILEVSLRTGVTARRFDGTTRKQVMSDRSKYKRAAKDDIAYNMMRMWQGAVGVVPEDGLVSPAYVVAAPFAGVAPKFFSELFRTSAYMGEVDANSHGIVKDRNRLYWQDFKQIYSICPPIEEQRAIIRFIDYIDQRIGRCLKAKGRLLDLLQEYKQAIVYQAVTRGPSRDVGIQPSGVDWITDIPNSWCVWRIGHLARVGNGSTPSRSNTSYWQEGDYPWLTSSCANHPITTSADQYVTALALRECHLPRVQPGSVLIAITGQGKTRGKVTLLQIESTINQHLAYIAPRLSIATPEYLQFALSAAYHELRRISDDSGSTRGALTCEDLKSFKVALPPVEDQKEIVAVINSRTHELDEAIHDLRHEGFLLPEYRARLITDVVTGLLDVREAVASLPDEPDDPEGSSLVDEMLDEAGDTADPELDDCAEEVAE